MTITSACSTFYGRVNFGRPPNNHSGVHGGKTMSLAGAENLIAAFLLKLNATYSRRKALKT